MTNNDKNTILRSEETGSVCPSYRGGLVCDGDEEKCAGPAPEYRKKRITFYELLEAVKKKVDFEYFGYADSALALELCKIIAEVMALNPDSDRETRIGQDMIYICVLQEIYASLEKDHLELVIENYKRLTEPVKNKKAYLRAALYNSAFEIEAHYTNAVKCDTN